jgi:UDPglucose 6-dehydrogenase
MGKQNIAMIGCGKLGLPVAEMMSEKHNIKGYDLVPFQSDTVTCADSIFEAIESADIIFIAVPTPHNADYDGSAPTSHLPVKDFDYSIVKSVLHEIDLCKRNDALVVLISTVLPGTTRRDFSWFAEKHKFLISPYLIAMGTVKWDMVNPEMIMIGTEDGNENNEAAVLREFYDTIMQNSPRYEIGTWEEIETLKVTYNTFISAKLSLVNLVQDIAQKLGNMDAGRVCQALANSTRRIMGPAYMVPGLGDSGACHPRDNIALRWLSSELELGYDLFGEIMHSREVQAKNMAQFLVDCSTSAGDLPIVIIGKTYKPLVPYVDGSASMLVGHYVSELGGRLYYYDSILGETPPEDIGPAVFLMSHDPHVTYGEQLDQVSIFMESRPNSHASMAHTERMRQDFSMEPGSIIVDPWRKITPFTSSIKVIHYGNTRPNTP